jgi:hypothetical protein
MATKIIKTTTEVKSNISVSVIRGGDDASHTSAFFISIKPSKPPPTMSATASLNCVQPSP